MKGTPKKQSMSGMWSRLLWTMAGHQIKLNTLSSNRYLPNRRMGQEAWQVNLPISMEQARALERTDIIHHRNLLRLPRGGGWALHWKPRDDASLASLSWSSCRTPSGSDSPAPLVCPSPLLPGVSLTCRTQRKTALLWMTLSRF